MDLIEKKPITGGMKFINNVRKTSNLQNQNYENDWGYSLVNESISG